MSLKPRVAGILKPSFLSETRRLTRVLRLNSVPSLGLHESRCQPSNFYFLDFNRPEVIRPGYFVVRPIVMKLPVYDRNVTAEMLIHKAKDLFMSWSPAAFFAYIFLDVSPIKPMKLCFGDSIEFAEADDAAQRGFLFRESVSSHFGWKEGPPRGEPLGGHVQLLDGNWTC